MGEDLNARMAGVFPEIGIAMLAGGLSWVATPQGGLVMHWGEAGEPAWKMAAAAYFLVLWMSVRRMAPPQDPPAAET